MKNKYYLLIIPIVLFIGLSFWQFFTISNQQRKEDAENINRQIVLCAKNMDDKITDFQQSANFDFAERTYQILLNPETSSIPQKVKDTYIDKEKSRIKTFYYRHQVLISKIEVYNQNSQRVLVKNTNDVFEVSETQKTKGVKILYDEPKLIENKNAISYIQPVHDPDGKLVANIQFYLKVDEFLASQFDNCYIGKNTWQWAIDTTGNVIFHKSYDQKINDTFETDATKHFRIKLFDNESVSINHSLTTNKKTNVYSVFYPVSFFKKKIGIVFSAKTGSSQNVSFFSVFLYFLSTIIVITILYIIILNLFYRKK